MGIANIINNSTTTSGGEIVRELVNASDGAGLHFDGAAGYIDIASPPDLGTKLSFEFVCKVDNPSGTQNGLLVDFGGGSGRAIFGASTSISGNLGIYYNSAWATFGLNPLTDGSVHHIIASIDGTTATLYDNGNQIATATIGSLNIDGCTEARIGTNFVATGGFFNGTIYRTRFYNKALTSAEVQTAYERADVDFADQYGSQTELITSSSNRDFASGTGDWGANGITLVNDSGLLKVPQTAAYNPSNDLAAFNNGRAFLQKAKFSTPPNDKRYRLTLSAKATTSGSKLYFNFQAGSTTDISLNQVVTLTDSLATYSFDILPTHGTEPDYILLGLDTAEAYWIDNVSLVRTGCVSDYDLAFANPTQSLTVQDRAGSADGTCSASGVTQVQPIIQGNMRSLAVTTSQQAAGVPADGDIVATGQIKTAGGALATPSFAITNEAGLGMSRPTSNTLNFITASTERMRIDGSGNVTVNGPKLEVTDNLASAHTILKLKNTNAAAGYGSQIQLEDHDSQYYISIVDSDLMFFNGAATTFKLTAAGVVNISNLSASSDVQTDGSKNLITSSDKRLKNDIGELTAGLDIISNLEPHYFSWKNDETNTQQLGFFAQDVYEFLPEAAPREQKQNLVTPAVAAAPATYYEEGDELPEGKAVGDEKTPAVEAAEAVYEPATNEDGTPDYNWGFNGRPIIAALVAAVKELKAKVETLENA